MKAQIQDQFGAPKGSIDLPEWPTPAFNSSSSLPPLTGGNYGYVNDALDRKNLVLYFYLKLYDIPGITVLTPKERAEKAMLEADALMWAFYQPQKVPT